MDAFYFMVDKQWIVGIITHTWIDILIETILDLAKNIARGLRYESA
jgi:hypothetical protein